MLDLKLVVHYRAYVKESDNLLHLKLQCDHKVEVDFPSCKYQMIVNAGSNVILT